MVSILNLNSGQLSKASDKYIKECFLLLMLLECKVDIIVYDGEPAN